MPRASTLKFGRAYIFGLFAIALIGWGLYAAFNALRPTETAHVRLAAGSSVARRFQIAEALAADAREHDLYVDVVATGGFEDSIRQVSNGKLDLAMVSTGLEIPECKNLRVLAGLDMAPLHILVRRKFAKEGLSLVQIIKGRRINLGQPGTNDYMLASDIIHFLRLSPMQASGTGDYVLSSLSKEELTQVAQDVQTQSGPEKQASLDKLPDVVMTVASLPGALVQTLLDTGEYCLTPFPNVEPFLISDLTHLGGMSGSVDRALVEPTTIHAGMYLGDSVMPSGDCQTVGLRTLLLAGTNVPATAVKRVMQTVFETDFAQRVHPQSPRKIPTAYQVHPFAEAYLDRDKPLLTTSFFDTISEFLSIFGAFSAGALSLYGYLRRRRIRKPGEYLEEIRKIDALSFEHRPESDTRLSPDALARHIDERLNQLKEQVIRDYCDNRVQGEMALLSILSTLSDSRSRLHASKTRSGTGESALLHRSGTSESIEDSTRNPRRAA